MLLWSRYAIDLWSRYANALSCSWVEATKPNIISGFFYLDLLDLTNLNPTYILFCDRWSKIAEN
ncbi:MULTISPECIES: hypothetical protein [unclassified Moorena]|uniref:hypothetical protein n=1 Tax=unclassified Moorena TaxID=2683338 RepID=UPI0013C780DA|nr:MULTISPECIES: hypothetical protein [unclassified Moorena]NEO18172.1 hypothetical protein [Moorena sp. SIO4A5]NEQ60427.1 hypothetical protein [Moorena sp. SIO4A1]